MPSHISTSVSASAEFQERAMTVLIVQRLTRDRLPDPTVRHFLFFDLNSCIRMVPGGGRLCRIPLTPDPAAITDGLRL
jgi:hypothetical protein